MTGLDGECKRYSDFVTKTLATPTPNATGVTELDNDLKDALESAATTDPKEVWRFREHVVTQVKRTAARLVRDGETARWLAQADAATRGVSAGVNGPLAELLARQTGFPDANPFSDFRHGGRVAGQLDALHGSVPQAFPEPSSTEELQASCQQCNAELLYNLKADPHAHFLLKQATDDAACGRTTKPTPLGHTSSTEIFT